MRLVISLAATILFKFFAKNDDSVAQTDIWDVSSETKRHLRCKFGLTFYYLVCCIVNKKKSEL